MTGGYDEGYIKCNCFWGTEPGSLLRLLHAKIKTFSGMSVLDLGCGEGKNSFFCANNGASVIGIDVSLHAINNARANWGDHESVNLICGNVINFLNSEVKYDLIIAYGLLHCLKSEKEILTTIERMQRNTTISGYNIVCAFNDREQDLSAHPGFYPTLLPHAIYINLYKDWKIICASDSDLDEIHPHNKIPHRHSMTRILAQKDYGS